MITSGFLMWVCAGLSAGLLIGLAGAGGGIVAIPVLMYMGNMSFKDASGYSLIVICLGALFSWIAQRQFTRFRVSLLIVSTSVMSSYIVAGFKDSLPVWFDAGLLWIVCLFGLYKVWTMKREHLTPREQGEPYDMKEYLLAASCGLLLGPLVTIIGVGGGLVTVPFLLVFLRLPMKEAVATDIFSILLVAPFSAWAQGRFDLPLIDLGGLAVGVVLAVFFFQQVRHLLPQDKIQIIRKSALTFAIFLALLSSTLKSPFGKQILKPLLGEIHEQETSFSTVHR